jgi:hypothetical protein
LSSFLLAALRPDMGHEALRILIALPFLISLD